MKIPFEQIMNETAGMNPVQFEAYCETEGIQTDWLHVTLTDFNDGFYNVSLSDYDNAEVFANDGSEIEIETNPNRQYLRHIHYSLPTQ
jgi:hypothetical protein